MKAMFASFLIRRITRRGIGAALMILGGFRICLPAEAAPPNVVFILADDLRPDGLGSLGNPVIKSPNIDSIVNRGFIFRHAYTMGSMIGAVCVPSRTMLLTGQSMFRAKNEASGGDPATFTFPHAMRAAGYAAVHAGKKYTSPKKITDEFDQTYDEKFGAANADKVIDFIHREAGQKPLFVYFAPLEPHDPQYATAEYYAMYRPADIPLPAAFLPWHPFDNGAMTGRDEKTVGWPRTRENVTGKLARYYASISYLDAQVGRLVDALRQSGQMENTVFIVAGDNGLSLGEHGLIGKQNLYEFGGMHVPLVFASSSIPKGETNALVYLMDVFPTVCELAGVPKPARVEGKSLAPIMHGDVPRVREYLFTVFGEVQRAIRDERWKVIRYPEIDKTQLFDLQSDGHEMTDLAGQPDQAGRIAELLAQMKKAQQEAGDALPLSAPNPKPSDWSPAKLTPKDIEEQQAETKRCADEMSLLRNYATPAKRQ